MEEVDWRCSLRSCSSSLASLSHDKAKEIAVCGERECLRMSRGSLATMFGSVLSPLSMLEKQYFGLSFLLSRGFLLRKETSLKTDYEHLMTVVRSLKMDDDLLVKTLVRHVAIRLRMIDFYSHALAMGLAEEPLNPTALLAEITEINSDFEDSKDWSQDLMSIRHLLQHELVALQALLSAANEIARCRFIEAVLKLKVSQRELRSWSQLVQSSKEPKKLTSFASAFFKSSSEPSLYQWLFSLKSSIVAKFTLIFATQLQVSPAMDVKTFGYRQQLDLVGKLQLFQRRSEAQSVALIIDASMESNFSLGFTHPMRLQQVNPSGLNLFPVLYATPKSPSSSLMPGLIMLINEADRERSRIVRLRDSKSNIVFYVHWVETKLFLTILITDGSAVLKTNDVETFLNEFVTIARLNRSFALLRPGAK